MSSHRREQIIENCRWLLSQEVQVITFTTRKYFKKTPNPNHTRGPSEIHYYAAVLPKACSLESVLAQSDIEKEMVFKEFSLLSSDGAISTLLGSIEKRIGMVLEEEDGRIEINEDNLPEEYKVDKNKKNNPVPITKDTQTNHIPETNIKDTSTQPKDTPIQINNNTAILTTQANKLFEDIQTRGEEILDNVQKKGEEIISELISTTQKAKNQKRLPIVGDETKSLPTSLTHTYSSTLTDLNLSRLETQDTNETLRDGTTSRNPYTPNYEENIWLPQDKPHTPLKPNKITNTQTSKPTFYPPPIYHLPKTNNTQRSGLNIQLGASSPDPILTPTSSVMSDNTTTYITDAMKALIRDEVRLAMKEYQDLGDNAATDVFPLYTLTPTPVPQKFGLRRYV